MKVIKIKDYVYREGEYIVGSEATGSHACYLMYGVIKGDEEREMKPGEGHEEIIAIIEGEVEVYAQNKVRSLKKGEALYLRGEEAVKIKPAGGKLTIYVVAGGHSDSSHHH